MQVTTEKTVFMQKAIYYVSKIIAARGIIELTDRHLNFQVSPLDASFGMKNFTVDIFAISDISMECGGLHPKVVIMSGDKKHEFVLAKGRELYDRIKSLQRDPLQYEMNDCIDQTEIVCTCGKSVNHMYQFCPWCGKRL